MSGVGVLSSTAASAGAALTDDQVMTYAHEFGLGMIAIAGVIAAARIGAAFVYAAARSSADPDGDEW